MPRLIDADYLYALFDGGFDLDFDEEPNLKKELLRMIESAPTVDAVPLEDYKSMEQTVNKLTKAIADAEPVRHGHWKFKSATFSENAEYECSECGFSDEHAMKCEVPYCWHCGAKMDAPTQKSVGNALEALDRWKKEPEINPCRGCEDYDGKGGCLSHGGCGEGREDG